MNYRDKGQKKNMKIPLAEQIESKKNIEYRSKSFQKQE